VSQGAGKKRESRGRPASFGLDIIDMRHALYPSLRYSLHFRNARSHSSHHRPTHTAEGSHPPCGHRKNITPPEINIIEYCISQPLKGTVHSADEVVSRCGVVNRYKGITREAWQSMGAGQEHDLKHTTIGVLT
jgi:hypothetical protein